MLSKKVFKEKIKYFLNKKIIICVSGGLDSMVLLNLCLLCKMNLSVCHVNFELRKNDSYEDEIFIRNFCLKNNIFFFIKRIDIKYVAKQNKTSIQVAARNVRYVWFHEILYYYNYKFIFLAHHLDDSIETFCINLLRGSGIEGLRGISFCNKKLIRPLLFFYKQEILNYAVKNKIQWREDVSNYQFKYLRNNIRHNMIPIFKQLSNNFYKSFKKTFTNLNECNVLVNSTVKLIKKQITTKIGFNSFFYWEINIKKLLSLQPIMIYLKKIFYNYGFNDINNLFLFLNSSNNCKFFHSLNYTITKNKKSILLIDKNFKKKIIYELQNIKEILSPIYMSFKITTLVDHKSSGFIDFNKIKFPLYLRKYQNQDYFYPIGMKNKKKVSKYFKDLKISFLEKNETWILCNHNQHIIWIVNFSVDRRFKVDKKTKKILNFYYNK